MLLFLINIDSIQENSEDWLVFFQVKNWRAKKYNIYFYP